MHISFTRLFLHIKFLSRIFTPLVYHFLYTNGEDRPAPPYTVVSKLYVFYCMVFCVYSHTVYICVYTNRQVHPAPPYTVVRKSYVFTAWYSLYIRTRYTFVSAQEWTNRTLAVHERSDSLLFSTVR